jgi:hypothetical protein
MNDIAIISYAFQKETIVFSMRSPISFAPIIADAWSPAEITGYVDHPSMGRVGAAAGEPLSYIIPS